MLTSMSPCSSLKHCIGTACYTQSLSMTPSGLHAFDSVLAELGANDAVMEVQGVRSEGCNCTLTLRPLDYTAPAVF